MKTRLVIVNIDRCVDLLAHPERFCSTARLESCSRISHPLRRTQGYAAELALSYALSGDKLSPPDYGYEISGRPIIEGGFVSLSHSGKNAVCAVSDVPVGVDIEERRTVDPKLARRILCPAELKNCVGSEYLLGRFVMKEAYLKLTGEGVFGGLNSIYECEGRVFRDGVLAGFSKRFDTDAFFGCVVTEREQSLETVWLDEEYISALN